MSIFRQILRTQNVKLVNQAFFNGPSRFCSAAAFDTKKFDEITKKNKIVIFMKGNPEQPMCGFSNAVVQIMRMHGVNYDSYNVLENDNLRQGIKDYSNWPTIPQVYINGEFVGGCDILLQMHQSGDLIEELKKVGITSALLKEASEKPKE
ncbi:GLRX5 family protein [Megaselia abdita]